MTTGSEPNSEPAINAPHSNTSPRVFASPGALNQVWTNLIDNAIDAMDGEGTLRLTTRA